MYIVKSQESAAGEVSAALLAAMAATKIILAVNAGSSSLKTTLFEAKDGQLTPLVSAEVSGFTSPPAKEKYTRGSNKATRDIPDITSHNDAFEHILETYIGDGSVGAVRNKTDIDFVCHRVVHGGDYGEDQIINEETYHKIEGLEDLAPLCVPLMFW